MLNKVPEVSRGEEGCDEQDKVGCDVPAEEDGHPLQEVGVRSGHRVAAVGTLKETFTSEISGGANELPGVGVMYVKHQ